MAVDDDNSADDLNAQELASMGIRVDPPKAVTVGEPFDIKEIKEVVTSVEAPHADPVVMPPETLPPAAPAPAAPAEKPKLSIFDEIKQFISELEADVRAGVVAHFVEQEKTKRVGQIVEALTAAKEHQKVLAIVNKPDTVIKNVEGAITHQGFSDAALATRKANIDAHSNLQSAIEGALKGDMSKLSGAVAKVNSLKGSK